MRLARGEVYTRLLVIPEGYNVLDIARSAGGGTGQLERLCIEIENVGTDPPGTAGAEPGRVFISRYDTTLSEVPRLLTTLTAMVKRFSQEAARIGLTENVSEVVTLHPL